MKPHAPPLFWSKVVHFGAFYLAIDTGQDIFFPAGLFQGITLLGEWSDDADNLFQPLALVSAFTPFRDG